MSSQRFARIKDPDAVLPYGFDWSVWLTTGDTVASASWAITAPTGDATPITVDSSSLTTTITTAVLSGGTLGNSYEARCSITTAVGYAEDRTLHITVIQR